MALINKIDGNLLRFLVKNNPSPAASSPSTLSGKGVGASFDAASTSLTGALNAGADAFSRSALRLNTLSSALEITNNNLTELLDITNQMLDLADAAAENEVTDQDRVDINSKFLTLVAEYRKVVDGASSDESDFLEKSDVAKVIEQAGIDLSSASKLGQSFAQTGGADGQLGTEPISSEDIFFTAINAGVVTPTTAIAPSGYNPLSQNLSTQGGAIIAQNTLGKLREELEQDLEGVGTVLSEVKAALKFAVAGVTVFDEYSTRSLGANEADSVAREIAASIRSETSDNQLAAHSEIDLLLSAELLGV